MKCLPYLLLTLLLTGAHAGAAELRLYRYTNAEGNLVIEPSVPPEYIAKGYEVINSKGRVLEVIPPAPTAEELMQQREAELRALADEQASKRQQELDEALLATYSSPDEVMQALNRALDEIDARIVVERGNMARLQQDKEAHQAIAARHERSGRAVPQALMNEIGQFDEHLARLEQQINDLQQSKQSTRLQYVADQRRVEALLAVDRVRAEDWPAELKLDAAQLPGLWRRHLDNGAQQEWVLNPSGSFTSLRELPDGRRQLILGNWALKERELFVEINTQHLTDSKGATQILSNPPPRRYPVLDFKETEKGHELVLQVGTEVVRLRRH